MAGPAGAALKYPDLRTMPPADVHLGTELVGGENHYVVRFSNNTPNAGDGVLELHGTSHFPPDGLFDASQWIYDDVAGIQMEPVGTFQYHPSHTHFHFDDYARYELWTKRAYDRAAAANFTTGKPQWISKKLSFCILDLYRADPNRGLPAPIYQTCTPVMEGISPGWGDSYDYLLPDQWIDVGSTPLVDGDYVLRSVADPSNRIWESPGKADPARESEIANSGVTAVKIVNGHLATSG
jgi:hypothetical protein